MEEYKPNSHKSKENPQQSAILEKKIEKVIDGSAKTRKKKGVHKLAGVFLSDDVDHVKSYILEDILLPAIKDFILDTVKALLGVSGRTGKSSTASKVSYRSYYDKENDRRSDRFPKARTGYDYDDIVLDNRGEAEDVLSRMDELISVYGLVSVADLYDLVGVTGNYTDNKYGWTDIRSASVIKVRDGYMLKLPRVLPLN